MSAYPAHVRWNDVRRSLRTPAAEEMQSFTALDLNPVPFVTGGFGIFFHLAHSAIRDGRKNTDVAIRDDLAKGSDPARRGN
jgi:hypothetical protein